MCRTDLDAVASPVIQAWKMPWKNLSGLRRVMMKKLSESVTQAWKRSPTITVSMYMPSDMAVLPRSSMLRILPAIRHIRPNGAYLSWHDKRHPSRPFYYRNNSCYTIHQSCTMPSTKTVHSSCVSRRTDHWQRTAAGAHRVLTT